jgi:hypothetical protein
MSKIDKKKRDNAKPVTIYVLKNPITKRVFYVGSTYLSLSYTLSRHINQINSQSASKGKIIRKLADKGKKPIIEAVDSCRVEHRHRVEAKWIEEMSKKHRIVNIYC